MLRWLGPLLPAVLLAGCVMFGFRRGDTVEPVPKGYENLPLPPGWTEQHLSDPTQIDRLCRAIGATKGYQDYNPAHQIASCAQRSTHTIYMPDASLRDPEWMQIDQDHERLHAWGGNHIDHGNKGWQDLPSLMAIFPPQAAPAQPPANVLTAQAVPVSQGPQPNALRPIPPGLLGASARQGQ